MKPPYLWGLIAVGSVLTACGGSTTAGAGADSGASVISGDDGSNDATGASDAPNGGDAVGICPAVGDAAGGPTVYCGVNGTPFFPTFCKACSTDDDCFLVTHRLGCCGDVIVMAISKGEVPGFRAAEFTCEAEYPVCKCASNSVTYEDGVAYAGTVYATSSAVGSCVGNSCVSKFNGPTFGCGDKVCAIGIDYCQVHTSDGAPPAYACVFVAQQNDASTLGCGSFAIAAGCTRAQSQGNVTVTCH